MKIYVDTLPKNCNYCVFRENMSQHWNLEDYCFLNKKKTSEVVLNEDCPLSKLEDKINGIKRQSYNY